MIIHDEHREPVGLYVDECTMGCRDMYHSKAYAEFLQHMINRSHPICHLEALNVIMAIKTWAQKYKGKLLHLFYSAAAVVIFQAVKGLDIMFVQASAREVRLTCAIWDITQSMVHMAGE